jgi:hypothetical protein
MSMLWERLSELPSGTRDKVTVALGLVFDIP